MPLGLAGAAGQSHSPGAAQPQARQDEHETGADEPLQPGLRQGGRVNGGHEDHRLSRQRGQSGGERAQRGAAGEQHGGGRGEQQEGTEQQAGAQHRGRVGGQAQEGGGTQGEEDSDDGGEHVVGSATARRPTRCARGRGRRAGARGVMGGGVTHLIESRGCTRLVRSSSRRGAVGRLMAPVDAGDPDVPQWGRGANVCGNRAVGGWGAEDACGAWCGEPTRRVDRKVEYWWGRRARVGRAVLRRCGSARGSCAGGAESRGRR